MYNKKLLITGIDNSNVAVTMVIKYFSLINVLILTRIKEERKSNLFSMLNRGIESTSSVSLRLVSKVLIGTYERSLNKV